MAVLSDRFRISAACFRVSPAKYRSSISLAFTASTVVADRGGRDPISVSVVLLGLASTLLFFVFALILGFVPSSAAAVEFGLERIIVSPAELPRKPEAVVKKLEGFHKWLES